MEAPSLLRYKRAGQPAAAEPACSTCRSLLCAQGASGVRLNLANFNFSYTSTFSTLGIQGQATYYFAGNIQASV